MQITVVRLHQHILKFIPNKSGAFTVCYMKSLPRCRWKVAWNQFVNFPQLHAQQTLYITVESHKSRQSAENTTRSIAIPASRRYGMGSRIMPAYSAYHARYLTTFLVVIINRHHPYWTCIGHYYPYMIHWTHLEELFHCQQDNARLHDYRTTQHAMQDIW